jgi:hypothetical protein
MQAVPFVGNLVVLDRYSAGIYTPPRFLYYTLRCVLRLSVQRQWRQISVHDFLRGLPFFMASIIPCIVNSLQSPPPVALRPLTLARNWLLVVNLVTGPVPVHNYILMNIYWQSAKSIMSWRSFPSCDRECIWHGRGISEHVLTVIWKIVVVDQLRNYAELTTHNDSCFLFAEREVTHSYELYSPYLYSIARAKNLLRSCVAGQRQRFFKWLYARIQ